jgi:hypothetical protein
MRKVVRLTESDLVKIVKRVINESVNVDAVSVSEQIVKLFKNTKFWAPYKGLSDDGKGALKAFDDWWKKNIQPILNRIGVSNEVDTIMSAYKQIRKGILGQLSNDTVRWVITHSGYGGGMMEYEVDTDF